MPYWKSVPPRTVIAIGRSRTFHRPKAKNAGAPSRNSERSIGVSQMVRTPILRLATTTPTEVFSSGTSIFDPRLHQVDAARREHERQRVDPERQPDVDRCQQAGAREADGRGAEGRDLQEGVRRRQLVVARDLRDQRLVGGVEELLDAGVDEDGDEQEGDVDAQQERDGGHDDALGEVARDHDPAPVPAVHEDAGDEADDEARDGRGHQGDADQERRSGDAVDVDPGREVRERRAGRRDELGQPHQDEVGLLEHRGRRDPSGHHAGFTHRPIPDTPGSSDAASILPVPSTPPGVTDRPWAGSRTRGLARSVRRRTARIRSCPAAATTSVPGAAPRDLDCRAMVWFTARVSA